MNGQRAFTLYSFTLGFFIPLLLILLFYFLVICKLRTISSKHRSREKRKTHRKVTYLVLTVITAYVGCWLPYWIGQVYITFLPPTQRHPDFIFTLLLLAGCLSYVNSAVNPILYAFLSENFKKSFAKAFTCAGQGDVNAQLHAENSVFPGAGHSGRQSMAGATLGANFRSTSGSTTGREGGTTTTTTTNTITANVTGKAGNSCSASAATTAARNRDGKATNTGGDIVLVACAGNTANNGERTAQLLHAADGSRLSVVTPEGGEEMSSATSSGKLVGSLVQLARHKHSRVVGRMLRRKRRTSDEWSEDDYDDDDDEEDEPEEEDLYEMDSLPRSHAGTTTRVTTATGPGRNTSRDRGEARAGKSKEVTKSSGSNSSGSVASRLFARWGNRVTRKRTADSSPVRQPEDEQSSADQQDQSDQTHDPQSSQRPDQAIVTVYDHPSQSEVQSWQNESFDLNRNLNDCKNAAD
jgi:hypothetical protein